MRTLPALLALMLTLPPIAALGQSCAQGASCSVQNLTVTGTLTASGMLTATGPCQIGSTLYIYPGCFGPTGADIGAQINAADALLATSHGGIRLPSTNGCGPLSFYSTPIVINNASFVRGEGPIYTCLNYTPSTGTAFSFKPGLTGFVTGVMEDLYLHTITSGTTAQGLDVGPGNTCSGCRINRINIDNFKILASSESYGVEFSNNAWGPCGTASGSVGFQTDSGGSADDTKFHGGGIGGCAIDILKQSFNPIWLSQVVITNASTRYISTNGGSLVCDQCHFFAASTSPSPNWFNNEGFTMVTNSIFEDARTSGTPASEIISTSGTVYLAYDQYASSGETPSAFVACSSSGSLVSIGINGFPPLSSGCPGTVNGAAIASGTATMTTAAIATGNCGAPVTVAASGVTTSDTISWAFSAAPSGSNAGLVAWPTSGNVNFAYCPTTAETPAAATINWRVVR